MPIIPAFFLLYDRFDGVGYEKKPLATVSAT
jgi:hypothetical protein